ncbi:MAG: alpha/beta hydrolase, partial [Ignavibacteria bacterium]|nr:alpha/beta hydrolase [Ignavibacteria bacterium]
MYTSLIDSQKLKAYYYQIPNPKAFVCIFHGMAEHQLRYKKFANLLNDNGFSVLTIDHRGHGESLFDGNLKGYFADEDGWSKNLEDLHGIIS